MSAVWDPMRMATQDERLSNPRSRFDDACNAKHAAAREKGESWFATPEEMRALWDEAVRGAAEYRQSKKQTVSTNGAITRTGLKEVAWACRGCGRDDLPMWRQVDGTLRCTECVG